MNYYINNNGQAKVITVKSSSWGAKAIVEKIVVYKADPDYDYVLTGQYSSEVSLETLYGSDARSVDCTGLTGNDVTVKSQNKNCIVVAKMAQRPSPFVCLTTRRMTKTSPLTSDCPQSVNGFLFIDIRPHTA